VTLFRGVPAAGAAARPADVAPGLVSAPAAPRALLPGSVEGSGGVPAVAGRGYFVPGGIAPVPYEAIGTRHISDITVTGAFEPQLRSIAYMSNGNTGGAIGGNIPAAAPAATRQLSTRLAPPWLDTAIARSGVDYFAYRSIAQDAEQLAQWNRALRMVAARPDSVYARTLGLPLTYEQASAAYFEVQREFFQIRGISGSDYNVHHWNRRALFPELAVDPRNLYLLETGIEEGRRVGEHIFAHWVSQSGNPYSGPARPGAIQDLGWPRSVIAPLE
jgi:hypothetical protein